MAQEVVMIKRDSQDLALRQYVTHKNKFTNKTRILPTKRKAELGSTNMVVQKARTCEQEDNQESTITICKNHKFKLKLLGVPSFIKS